jgi:hypothetical protein
LINFFGVFLNMFNRKKLAFLTTSLFVLSMFTMVVAVPAANARTLEPRGYNWTSDPTGGDTISNTVTVTLDADYNAKGLYSAKVCVYKGTAAQTSWVTMTKISTYIWQVTWDTTGFDDGTDYRLRYRMYRTSRSSTYAYTGYMTIANGGAVDTEAPVVSITNPANGATVGDTVSITYSATDNVGVTSRSIKIDGVQKSTGTSYSWDTTAYSDGSHTILVEAWDAAGNKGSDSHTVTVDNSVSPPPGDNELTSGVTASSSLASVGAEEMWYIEVGSGYSGLHGVLTCGSADFDLYFRKGAEPTTTVYDLRGYTSGGEDITYSMPGAGTWYVMVKSYSGTGAYQLTCTLEEPTSSDWGTGGKYAIIVGISDYQSISDLSYCDEDATDWSNFLVSRGYEVHVYGDSHPANYPNYIALATEANVRAAIQELAGHAQAGDEVLFITSGHGSGDGKGSSFLCMYDCSGSAGCYYDTEIAADLSNFNTGVNLFVFIDHCYSGGIGPELLALSQNVYCTTTCTANGYGYDDGSHHNGAWTYEYLEKYWVNYPTYSAEAIYDMAAATYPHTGGDACMEFDGFSGSYYL